uniref:Germacrene A synthase n=1 Tax=Pogostemon cablin TaxID=28511 RepID=TPGAS_POGCB|nr:RecName: Full=Germacrene A synthase; AltName: Full=PatTpsCF2 [Pogostemon cablin]AAS86321.1 germacrene A synthase [Pogostemon cablin]
MAVQISETVRPFANFSPNPSLWGDQFINHKSKTQQISRIYLEEIEGLKNEVKCMLTSTPEGKMADTVNLIDTLERLGVSYHFEKEIEEKMKHLFNLIKADNYKDHEGCDLYTDALHFRLFRQHGYPISSGIFNKWMDGNGKFKESIKSDAKGLLSLYEACCLRTHGDTLLDEALVFATASLKSMAANLASPLRKQVEHALFQHLHFGIPRVEARHFITFYEEEEHKNEMLLRFAKLDFNALQALHKEELSEISKWWKDLDLISKLPYARDRVVESYFWAVGVYYQPKYSRARIMLTKTIAMTAILDDTYDSYGTLEELDVLTKAIERWDIKEINGLPEYIKGFYKQVLKLYQQLEEELAKEGRSYAVYYAIEACKELARSYAVEAKWFKKGYLPGFEEYLINSLVTSTAGYLNIISFFGVESVTKEDFEWFSKKPRIAVATQIITRVIDDIATYEVEKEKGQSATGIDCYMKEHGVSKEKAMQRFYEMSTNAWKDINEEGLSWPSSFSRDIFVQLRNFSRMVDVTYGKNEDGYSKPEKILKPLIIALFVDQIKL